MVTARANVAVSSPIAMVSFLLIVDVMVMKFWLYMTIIMAIGVPNSVFYCNDLIITRMRPLAENR